MFRGLNCWKSRHNKIGWGGNGVKGKEIAALIWEWLEKSDLHPDDVWMLFAEELIEKLEEDK